MKNIKTFVTAVSFLSAFGINNIQAQTKQSETIILQDNTEASEIKIEINNGEVFIDGKRVAPYNANRNLKIIKKLGKSFKNGSPNIELDIESPFDATMPSAMDRAMLGIKSSPTDGNIGAKVESVNTGSPAAKADLQEGDVITKVDNMIVTNPQDLANAIATLKPGDKVNIELQRNGNSMEQAVTLADRGSSEFPFNPKGFDNMEDMMKNFENMMKGFGNMDDMQIKKFGIEEDGNNMNGIGVVIPKNDNPKLGAQIEERADGRGLRVVNVTPNTPADKAGLKAEDIITSFGGNRTNSIKNLSNAIADVKDKKSITLDVQRNGSNKTLYIEFTKSLLKKDF